MAAKTLIISAPGSGHGKTLITLGLARALQRRGERVRVFKVGPDYLDPQLLEQGTGLDVRQLDNFMLGEAEIRAELARAAEAVDYVLIEGVMGLFDGSHPTAQLAKTYELPVLLVIDASAMAQTIGALALGLASYDPDIRIAGVLANRVGSRGHGDMLAAAIREPLRFVGYLQRDQSLAVGERHLGVDTQARERAADIAEAAAEQLAPALERLDWGELAVDAATLPVPAGLLAGRRIAVARDAAFSFIYHADLDWMRREGAELAFFSPLADAELPACDALYLPGGYPELHLDRLRDNSAMRAAITGHIEADKPCVAECGGMLYLMQSLAWGERREAMAGLLPGQAVVGERLAAIGYQQLPGTTLRGHTFHYATVEGADSERRASSPEGKPGEYVYHYRNTIASFVHWYFASDPETVAAWFRGDADRQGDTSHD